MISALIVQLNLLRTDLLKCVRVLLLSFARGLGRAGPAIGAARIDTALAG